MPLAAARAATALPRLPVEAQASVSLPSSAALAEATPTTRSLNECVGLVWSSFRYSSRTPTALASRGARMSWVHPGPLLASSGALVGSRGSYRHSERGPAAIRSRVARRATRSQSYTGSSGPKQRRQLPLATAGYSTSQTRHLRVSTDIRAPTILLEMKFCRIDDLPPYVFATVDQLKRELRRQGRDVIDLGFGNPDIPSPPVAVEKLREAALNPRNHRYSVSRGIDQLRRAIAEHYERRFGVALDPETQVASTIGAKEGLAHLMWVLVEPGDSVVVPTPAYPIHRVAPRLAGATVVSPPAAGGIDAIAEAVEDARPKVVIVSYPHNPTTAVATREDMQRLVDLAREHEFLLVHDFAYADVAFDGHEPPSMLAADGAFDCAVELYSLTKSFSMAGWRVGFVLGRADVVAALAKLKSYLDYGTFQPIQIAATVALREASDYPAEVCEVYRSRRDALIRGLERAGWPVEPPRGTMFVWAPLPERFRALGSLETALRLAREAHVAVSPGIGFGDGGDEHVRFALVENEQRIGQATRAIRRLLAH